MAIYGENMSFVFLIFPLEPIWRFRGLKPRTAKRLFRVAGEGDTDFVTSRLFLGERFLLDPPMTPLAATEIPVLNACHPACLRRGVAWRKIFSWHGRDHSLSDRVLQNTRACLCLPCSQGRETFTLMEMKCHIQRPLLEWHDISCVIPYIDFDCLKAFPLKSDIMHIFVDPSHQLTVISFGRHDSEQRNLTVTHHTRFHHIAVYIERIYRIHIDHWIRLYLIVSKWGKRSHP